MKHEPSTNAFSSADYYYNVIIYDLSLGVVAPSHCVSPPPNFMGSGTHSPPGLLGEQNRISGSATLMPSPCPALKAGLVSILFPSFYSSLFPLKLISS